MFDKEEEAAENKATFAACVRQINEEMAKGAEYQFVVVTGDIGVENLVSVIREKDGKREFEESPEKRDEEIRKGAAELASIMAPSRVKVWLFVPGNNDLYDEEITTLKFYQQFLDELKKRVTPWGITIKDLCRTEEPRSAGAASPPAGHVIGSYAFIGFNDASFKNNNDTGRVARAAKVSATSSRGFESLDAQEVKAEQEKYVQQVLDQVDKYAYAYVFYHIPEIDDPYLISGKADPKLITTRRVRNVNRNIIGEANQLSAWFVALSVRELWEQVVKRENVKGLFAGHFHSPNRGTYLNYHWMSSTEYLSGSLSKLYVCPPLAVKLQGGEKVPGRGFQEVSINNEGRVLDESGQSGIHIFWYDPATGTFSANLSKKDDDEALRQFQLGGYFERNGRIKDAETAYTKALEGESQQLRDSALDSLRRILEKQVSPLNRYLLTPLALSLSPEGTYLFLAACLLIILVALWRVLGYYLSKRNRAERYQLFYNLLFVLVLIGIIFLVLLLVPKENFYLPAVVGIVLTALAILGCLWLSWLVFKRVRCLTAKRGKNKLVIVSLADASSVKLGSSLPSVFAATRQEIIKSRQFEGLFSRGATLPVIILGEDTALAELAEMTVPGRWGALLGWLLRRTTDPKYSVRTSLQSSGGQITLIMSLEESGEAARIWADSFPDASLHTGQRKLAYQVLICLFRRINYGDRYGDAS